MLLYLYLCMTQHQTCYYMSHVIKYVRLPLEYTHLFYSQQDTKPAASLIRKLRGLHLLVPHSHLYESRSEFGSTIYVLHVHVYLGPIFSQYCNFKTVKQN